MRKTYTTILACCLMLTGNAQNPNFEWTKQLSGDFWNEGHAIATDANGNIYTTGHFTGTADFDPGPDVYNLTSAGGLDIFIQKLDKEGNFLWAKRMGRSSWDVGNSIATDANGNVYTTGGFFGTVDFDPGPDAADLVAGEKTAVFIQKLDPDGNFLWAKQIVGTYDTVGNAITTDSDGNVYTTGYLQGTADFDPGTGVYDLTSEGATDIFIQKLDTDGNFLWATNTGGVGTDEGRAITTDADGNVYITGDFDQTADFDPGPGVQNLTSDGILDIFIQKLDSDGNFLWAAQMGGILWDMGFGITTDAVGNVYTTGYFTFEADFDPGEGVENLSSLDLSFSDVFIQKLDTDGNFLWAKKMGGMFHDQGHSIATDTLGNVYTTGYFDGTVDFDPGTDVQNLTSDGSLDIL